MHEDEEQTLVIIKPDAINRGLFGEITHRFERKGLKVVALKMTSLDEGTLEEHYAHHADKPFFEDLKKFMQETPVVLMVLSGINAIKATRYVVGDTAGHEADPGSIRGDFAMSVQSNLVHASDSPETAEAEINLFFDDDELFEYQQNNFSMVFYDAEG